jgi:hypothetical protein
MLRIAGVSALVLATGCLVDPGPNQTEDPNARVCTMSMTITGSFAELAPAPLNPDGTPYTGCWPYGTWTFTAARGATNTCQTAPTILPQYQFKVDQATDPENGDIIPKYVYMTDPTAHNRVKVSQGGDGLCEGELNVFSTDGKEVWILKPEMYADKTLRGDGEYSLYKIDQWLGDQM